MADKQKNKAIIDHEDAVTISTNLARIAWRVDADTLNKIRSSLLAIEHVLSKYTDDDEDVILF